MHRLLFLLAATSLATCFAGVSHPAAAAENRCGWLVNPTPGNWWLSDSEAEWTLSTQGADSDVPGMDLIPDVTEHDFVSTNGPSYGYACACMSVDTARDADGGRITAIHTFKQLPLSKCDRDKALTKPE